MDIERVIENARLRSVAAIDKVCAQVDANEMERRTIEAIAALTRHGYKTVDIKIRKDGRETWYEGDWIVRLLSPHPTGETP